MHVPYADTRIKKAASALAVSPITSSKSPATVIPKLSQKKCCKLKKPCRLPARARGDAYPVMSSTYRAAESLLDTKSIKQRRSSSTSRYTTHIQVFGNVDVCLALEIIRNHLMISDHQVCNYVQVLQLCAGICKY